MSIYDWQASSYGPSQAASAAGAGMNPYVLGAMLALQAGGGIMDAIGKNSQRKEDKRQFDWKFREDQRRWQAGRDDQVRRSQLTEPMRDLLGQVLMARLGAPQTRFRPGDSPEFANDYDLSNINDILAKWREEHTDPTYGGLYG